MKRHALVLFTALLAASAARATPNFPPFIRASESLASEPQCTLCHLGTPGVGTVTTPFGRAMRDRGLVPYDTSSLSAALSAMRADAVDSDRDGTTDLDELAAGTDPNVSEFAPPGSGGGGDALQLGEPAYGCTAAGSGPAGATFVALATLAIRAARRRRGRSAAPSADLPSHPTSHREKP